MLKYDDKCRTQMGNVTDSKSAFLKIFYCLMTIALKNCPVGIIQGVKVGERISISSLSLSVGFNCVSRTLHSFSSPSLLGSDLELLKSKGAFSKHSGTSPFFLASHHSLPTSFRLMIKFNLKNHKIRFPTCTVLGTQHSSPVVNQPDRNTP